MENKFLSNKKVLPAEKRAIGYVFTTLAYILTDNEDLIPDGIKGWLNYKNGLCGSSDENNYRRFLNYIIKTKNENPNINLEGNPYLSLSINFLTGMKKAPLRFANFANNLREPETFNMQEYMKLVCKYDQNGKVIGLSENVLRTPDKQNENLQEAFMVLFGKVASIQLETDKSASK